MRLTFRLDYFLKPLQLTVIFFFTIQCMQRRYILLRLYSLPIVHLGQMGYITAMFAVGLAVGVMASVGSLFYVQVCRAVIDQGFFMPD